MELSKTDTIYEIPLNDIDISNLNVRITDRKKNIDDLAKSINDCGLLQPVVLRGAYGTPPYDLIVGQRRFYAHESLKKETIQAVFREISDDEAKILSLAENMQRVELNHADKAEAITSLYKKYKTVKKVSEKIGLSEQTIREYVKLEVFATPKAKKLLRKGKVYKTDVQRVIKASQSDNKKADRLLEEMTKLTKYEQERAFEYGSKITNNTHADKKE